MKKGKTSKLNILKEAKCHYGTVDSKNFKSLYIVIQTWIEPRDEYDNWDRISGLIKRQIQHTLIDVLDYDVFDKKQIVDLDLRTSGIQKNKKSFFNLEITLFLNNETYDFKSTELRDKIKDITNTIYYEDLKKSKYFTLNKTKNTDLVLA